MPLPRMHGFANFQIIVVGLLAIIAFSAAYLALGVQPGSPKLSEADRIFKSQEENMPSNLRQIAKAEVSNLFQAIRLYKLDHGRYPSQQEGLAILITQPKPYLETLPIDPWGNQYQYTNPGKMAEVEVFTAGPDGIVRTPDDIGSWQP